MTLTGGADGTNNGGTPAAQDRPGILHIVRSGTPSGAERMMLMCAEESIPHGYRPWVAFPAGGTLGDATGPGVGLAAGAIEALEPPRRPAALLGCARGVVLSGRRVETLCREQGIALIHAHGPVACLLGWRAAEALSLPLVCHAHEASPGRLPSLALRYVRRGVTRFICISDASGDMLRVAGVAPGRISLIRNAVRREFFETDHLRPDLVIGPGPHIGVFAMIYPSKGQHVFLDAMERLARRLPTARFYLFGGLDGPAYAPYIAGLQQRAGSPALRDRVVFAGFRPDVPACMAAMDVVVCPSVRPEGGPLAVMEAMALGRRVVATRDGGASEIVEDGVTGRLVPAGNAVLMAEAVLDLVTRPAGDPMGHRGNEAARAGFHPDRIGHEISRLYQDVLAQ